MGDYCRAILIKRNTSLCLSKIYPRLRGYSSLIQPFLVSLLTMEFKTA